MSSDDREVQDLFRQLRQEDADAAPPFERLAAGPQRVPSRWLGMHAAMVSMAALLALTAGWLLVTRQNPETAPLTQLSKWQSPTGFLMNFSGDSVFKGRSILDLPPPPDEGLGRKENDR